MIALQQGEDVGDISLLSSLRSIDTNLGKLQKLFSSTSIVSETVLFDGDQDNNSKPPNVINVIGEVLNPIAFDTLRRYWFCNIRARGYQSSADKKGVYVIKVMVWLKKLVKLLCRKFWSRIRWHWLFKKINTGDSLIRNSLAPITQIISDLALLLPQ